MKWGGIFRRLKNQRSNARLLAGQLKLKSCTPHVEHLADAWEEEEEEE